MANNPNDGYAADDFLDQIFSINSYAGLAGADSGSSSETALSSPTATQLHHAPMSSLGLCLDNGRELAADNGTFAVMPDMEAVNNMANFYPGFDQLQVHPVPYRVHQAFQGHLTASRAVTGPHQPFIRPRVRARRGHATDPHSIAERLRRERISERIKALQELVPNCNKTDRAAMLDEILDYVKFLRLQVKILSMSRIGGAGAVAQLVADIPLQPIEGETSESGSDQSVWEKWSDEETEHEVAKLMKEDMGAAMQFLQSKSLCIMPISLAALIYPTATQPHNSTLVKPEPLAPHKPL